ncbi:MAG: OmpA family protein, partial [Pseudomonadales bacterium]
RSLKVLNVEAFVLDPRGTIYDSVTAEPIGGVTVSIADAAGNLLPEACLAVPAQQGQVTGSDAAPSALGLLPGAYEFSLDLGAAPECPVTETEYQIVIDSDTLPGDYTPSILRRPEANSLNLLIEGCTAGGVSVDANAETDRCEVSQLIVPEVTNGLQPYYLSISLSEDSTELLNNHIPLDPPLDGLVLLTKASVKDTVSIGELAPYTVRVENLTQYSLEGIEVIDTQAAGFALAEESVRLHRAGADGQLNTMDDIVAALGRSGNRPVRFEGVDLAPREVVQVSYVLRVGSGVTRGTHPNVVVPELNGQVVGNQASAEVEVVADAIFDLTTLLGKVFSDANENGTQDENEPGLPGVRIATVGGEWIITDEFGRFSLRGVDPGKNAWGRNAILKVDPASLPEGSVFTTENPRVLRITGGLMNQFDFGVKLPEAVTQAPEMIETVSTQTTQVDADIEPVRFRSGQFDITEEYLEQLRAAIDPLRQVDNLRLVVEGHTDNEPLSPRAEARYGTNYGLSNERAKAVAQFLSQGLALPMSQFVTQGYGPDRPVAPNDTASGMALNRRVEITITYDRTIVERVSSAAGRQAVIEMSERYFDNHRLLPGATGVLNELAKVLGEEDLASIELRIPAGAHFVNRRAAIMAYLHGLSGASGAQNLQKLVIKPTAQVSSRGTTVGRWLERLAFVVLNALVPSAMADDVVCLSESLCESDGLKIYVSEVTPVSHGVMGQRGLAFGGEAKVWATSEPGRSDPRFAIRAPRYAERSAAGLAEPVQFWLDTSFPDQVSEWTLNLYDARDTTRSRPVAEISGALLPIGDPLIWDGRGAAADLAEVPAVAFELKFKDLSGQSHKVKGGLIDLFDEVSEADAVFPIEDQTWFEAIENANHLINADIPMPGDLVTFNTSGLPAGGTLMIGGHRYPIGKSGELSIRRQMV